MIYNKDQFEVVRDYIKGFTVVVDPVLFAKDGTPLNKFFSLSGNEFRTLSSSCTKSL